MHKDSMNGDRQNANVNAPEVERGLQPESRRNSVQTQSAFPRELHQDSDLIRLSDILTISRNEPLRRPIQMAVHTRNVRPLIRFEIQTFIIGLNC